MGLLVRLLLYRLKQHTRACIGVERAARWRLLFRNGLFWIRSRNQYCLCRISWAGPPVTHQPRAHGASASMCKLAINLPSSHLHHVFFFLSHELILLSTQDGMERAWQQCSPNCWC